MKFLWSGEAEPQSSREGWFFTDFYFLWEFILIFFGHFHEQHMIKSHSPLFPTQFVIWKILPVTLTLLGSERVNMANSWKTQGFLRIASGAAAAAVMSPPTWWPAPPGPASASSQPPAGPFLHSVFEPGYWSLWRSSAPVQPAPDAFWETNHK